MSNKLPSVTSDIPRDLRTFIDRLREIVSGTGNDRLVSAQDLINGGIAGPGNNGTLVPPTTGLISTPPAPKNLTATGGVYDVFVEWDNPTYYGHDYTEVYGGSTNVIGDAVLLGFTPGVNYVDTIGPSQSRYYWARFVNRLGVKGPFNAVSGTLGTTAAEVAHLLNVLTNQITQTQLYTDLGARINLIDGSTSLAGSVAARILVETQARLAADTALGSSITTLQSADSTQASQITTLQTKATTAESNIITLQTTTANQATSITSLTSRTTSAESNITTLQSTTASQASTLTSLGTRTTSAESNITTLQTTTANQATSITTLSSSVGTNTTAIQTEATTRASETGSLFSKYTVKIDTNGYVSGFGLASTANNDTPFSDFIIRADRFSIASPTGPGITPVIPFIVTTTTTTINGVTVTPGVYINGAFIQGGTIQGASIAGGTIENAKLINVSANKITGAALEATSYIESAAYISGSQGWKIHANGTAEFAAASIRGQLTASQINSNGLSVKDAAGNIILNAGTGDFTGSLNGTAASTVVSNASTALSTANSASSAASSAQSTANSANSTANSALSGLSNKISTDSRSVLSGGGGIAVGSLNWNSSGVRTSGYGIGITSAGMAAYKSDGTPTFVLDGSNGNASFAGTLSAADGTFAGTLTAAAVNAVNTINIAGDSVVTMDQFNHTIASNGGNNTGTSTFNHSFTMASAGNVYIHLVSMFFTNSYPSDDSSTYLYLNGAFVSARQGTEIYSATAKIIISKFYLSAGTHYIVVLQNYANIETGGATLNITDIIVTKGYR